MKLSIILTALLLIFSSCHLDNHDTSISIKEDDEIFQLNASFHPDKTLAVQDYIDDHLGSSTDASLKNTTIDATIILNDKTKFYMKSHPGYLKIKFNKEENSSESYEMIKDLCEGIKETVN